MIFRCIIEIEKKERLIDMQKYTSKNTSINSKRVPALFSNSVLKGRAFLIMDAVSIQK